MKFKKFIKEGIYISPEENKVKFRYSKEKFEDPIELLMGKSKKEIIPYISKPSIFQGIIVYSAYLFKINDITKQILRTLKGKSSKYNIDEDDINIFLKRTVQYLWHTLKDKKIDLLVTVESSSPLLNKFAEEFKNRISNILYLPSSIGKDVENIQMSPDTPKEFISDIQKVIKYAKEGKTHEMKKIYAQKRRFILNFLKLNPELIKKIEGNNILILDDILTSGSTLAEAIRLISIHNPKSIVGATIFKMGK